MSTLYPEFEVRMGAGGHYRAHITSLFISICAVSMSLPLLWLPRLHVLMVRSGEGGEVPVSVLGTASWWLVFVLWSHIFFSFMNGGSC